MNNKILCDKIISLSDDIIPSTSRNPTDYCKAKLDFAKLLIKLSKKITKEVSSKYNQCIECNQFYTIRKAKTITQVDTKTNDMLFFKKCPCCGTLIFSFRKNITDRP